MMKRIFLALLALGSGTAIVNAQAVPPAIVPVTKPVIITPKTQDSIHVDLIQQKSPANPQDVMLNQHGDQTGNVPSAVKQSFAAVMPNATDVSWNARDNHYEVEFTNNGTKKLRVYDSRGDLQELGIQQDVKTIPADIKSYVKKNYTGETIVSVYKEFVIGSMGASAQTMQPKPTDNTALLPGKMPDNTMAASDKQPMATDKSMSKKSDVKVADLSQYRVTTTTHLLYFDSAGKFNHEGYAVLTSGL